MLYCHSGYGLTFYPKDNMAYNPAITLQIIQNRNANVCVPMTRTRLFFQVIFIIVKNWKLLKSSESVVERINHFCIPTQRTSVKYERVIKPLNKLNPYIKPMNESYKGNEIPRKLNIKTNVHYMVYFFEFVYVSHQTVHRLCIQKPLFMGS